MYVYSVGGVLAAVEAVLKGEVNNAYCLVRPPGGFMLMYVCMYCMYVC